MLEIVALNDLASVLCARKFSFALQGGFTPKIPPLAKGGRGVQGKKNKLSSYERAFKYEGTGFYRMLKFNS